MTKQGLVAEVRNGGMLDISLRYRSEKKTKQTQGDSFWPTTRMMKLLFIDMCKTVGGASVEVCVGESKTQFSTC